MQILLLFKPVTQEPVDPQVRLGLASPEGLVERFLGRQKASTRQAYAQDLADFARFLGAESAQAAALQLLAGGPGLANQLVHDYLSSSVAGALLVHAGFRSPRG